jgi:hypothetical protein
LEKRRRERGEKRLDKLRPRRLSARPPPNGGWTPSDRVRGLPQWHGLVWRGKGEERQFGDAKPVPVYCPPYWKILWLARWLVRHGVETRVVQPSSVQVDRLARRAKSNEIDAELLLRTLLAWSRGQPRVC